MLEIPFLVLLKLEMEQTQFLGYKSIRKKGQVRSRSEKIQDMLAGHVPLMYMP